MFRKLKKKNESENEKKNQNNTHICKKKKKKKMPPINSFLLATLRSKIKKAFCVPIEDVPENKRKVNALYFLQHMFCKTRIFVCQAAMNNGLLAISKFLLFRWLEDNSSEGEQSGLTIKDKLYTDFQSLSDGYASGEVCDSLDVVFIPMTTANRICVCLCGCAPTDLSVRVEAADCRRAGALVETHSRRRGLWQ